MRVVVIGDVGVSDDLIHIGDEAMFDELVTQLTRRGATHITGISAHPAETAARYGIEAVHRIGFSGTPDARADDDDRSRRAVRTANGEPGLLAADDTAHAVIAAIAASDGVAIAGGGNMASTWPLHILERSTIGAIAHALGKPLVVTGQTIGPHLTAPDAELVRGLLSSAQFVGLREQPSLRLTAGLGVDEALLTQTIDDASFLGAEHRGDAAPDENAQGETVQRETVQGETAQGEAPYCVVTLANHIGDVDRDAFTRSVAALLDDVAETTGLEIVFFAHFGSIGDGPTRGDSVVHEAVRAAMSSARSRVHETTDARAAALLARGAQLSISSRYHPAVFAVSAGVPAIGIAVDDYTTTKLTGALGNFGQSAILPIAELVAGRGPAFAAEVWARRDAIRADAAALAPARRAASDAWWNRVADALS